MPQNWENTLSLWKKMLDKPKNVALKSGTGVSAAIEAVKTAEQHFDPHSATGYTNLDHALSALIQKCTETRNKFKLFTDAGQLLGTISHEAAERKEEIEKALHDAHEALAHVRHACDQVYAKIGEVMQDRAKAGAYWVEFKHELDNGLGRGFPKLQESIKVIQAMLPPHHKDSKQPLSNFQQAIGRMKEAAQG